MFRILGLIVILIPIGKTSAEVSTLPISVPGLSTAISIVQAQSSSGNNNVCKTWILAHQHPLQLEGIHFDQLNEVPLVLHSRMGNCSERREFFKQELRSDEDFQKVTHFGPSKFVPNCQLVFVEASVRQNSNINSVIQAIEALTIELVLIRLSRPHKDYFVYVSTNAIIAKFMSSAFVDELRYKYGVSATPIPKLLEILDGCCGTVGKSLNLFGRKCPSLLNGKHFHISAVVGPPMLRWKNFPNGSLEEGRGVYYSLVEAVGEHANFTFSIAGASSGGASGFKRNGKWYGLVGDVFERNADMGASAGITGDRHLVIDTGIPFAWIRRIFYVRAPPIRTNWEAFLWPLDEVVWLCTGVTFLLMIPVYYFGASMYFKSQKKQQHRFDQHVFVEVVTSLITILLEQASTARSKRGSTRIRLIILMWAFFCFILANGYRSKLFQFLTFGEGDPTPETHKDLLKGDYKIFFRYYGGVAHKYAQDSPDPTLKTISKRAILYNTSESCLIAMVLTDKSACLDWEYHGDFGANTNITLNPHTPRNELLRKSREPAQHILVSFLFRKRSPLTESFDMYFIQSFASGLYEKWISDDWIHSKTQGAGWLKSQPKSQIKRKIDAVLAELSTDAKPLPVDSLYSCFIVWFIGSLTALLVLLGEVVASACKKPTFKVKVMMKC